MTADPRQQDILRLLEKLPIPRHARLLDVGTGDGTLAVALAPRVASVVGTGLAFSTYPTDRAALEAARIRLVEAVLEHLPFADESFDVVLLAHVLEHCPNVGSALQEARRVLKPSGWLCVFVPPHESLVCGGHVSIGWHVGQLMYVLALNGFNVQQGHFAKRGYNVCGLVRKEPRPLPPLRYDKGDLRALSADGRFPVPIANLDPQDEVFFGDLDAVNWPWPELLQPKAAANGGWKTRLLRALVPPPVRPKLRSLLSRIARALSDETAFLRERINPRTLHR